MIMAMMRYGRQQRSEILSWYISDFFTAYDDLMELVKSEGIPDGG